MLIEQGSCRKIRLGPDVYPTSLARLRDMLGVVMRGAVPFVVDANLRSFRDVYDHSFQLLETIDNDRIGRVMCGISTSAFTLRRGIIRSRC